MKFESFLTSPRWEILKILSHKPSSPIELATELNTTSAYISQQLKILDAAELISKVKTGASEKGKPRSIFTLSNDFIYTAFLTKATSEKRLIHATDHHNTILKIWMIKDTSLHYYFEKLFWKLEENFDKIKGIFLDLKNTKLIVISDSKALKTEIEKYISTFPKKIDCNFLSDNNFKANHEEIILLYDNLLHINKNEKTNHATK